MPRDKGVQAVILCEDRTTCHFIRKYLEQKGVTRFVEQISPRGKGAGEAFVRRNYPIELKAYHSRKNSLNIILVVVIDADKNEQNQYTVDARKRYVEESPEFFESDVAARNPRVDRVAIFVPKRNIESWIKYLLNPDDFDETKNYKNRLNQKSETPKKAAVKLFRDPPVPITVASLEDACAEFNYLGL